MQTKAPFRLSHAPLALAVSLLSGMALAQDNTLDSIVVTADRQQSSLRDVSSSIFTVGSDVLDTVRHTHINEALTRVPGAWISRGNGQESLTAIRSPVLTGPGSCGAFQMAQDGIPLRATGFCNVNQLFEANSEQAGSVEVIRGPGSILYGANALHGAINVLTPAITDNMSDFSYETGSHQYNRVRLSHSNRSGNQGYRIDFNGNTDDGYKHDSGFDQQKLSIKHEYSHDGFRVTTSVHATNLNQETAGFIQGPDAYKDDDLKRVNPNPESFRDARSYRASSKFEWDLHNGTLAVTPYVRKTDMTFLQHYLPGTPQEENGQRSFGLQSMYTGEAGMLDWSMGLDFESTDGYLKETQYGPTAGSAFLVGTIPEGKHYDYQIDAHLLSPYLLVKYHLSEADQFNFGLRYENVEYDYDNRMIDGRTRDDGTACGFGGCRFNRPADRSDSFDNFSAQLGWIHDFDTGQQVYLSLARAFRAPDTSEMYRLQNNQSVADLDSEEADSIEIGYRANHDRVSYAVAAYLMEKDNVIYQDSNRNNISGAATRHRGVELNAAVNLRDNLTLTVASSYALHTYDDDSQGVKGNEIDTAPRLTGSAQLRWQIAAERSVELEWVHMDDYYTNETNTASYDGHDLVNLRYQAVAGKWYYGARITNLFDTDYAERADYAFGNERYFVGEPIGVYVNIGTRF